MLKLIRRWRIKRIKRELDRFEFWYTGGRYGCLWDGSYAGRRRKRLLSKLAVMEGRV